MKEVIKKLGFKKIFTWELVNLQQTMEFWSYAPLEERIGSYI